MTGRGTVDASSRGRPFAPGERVIITRHWKIRRDDAVTTHERYTVRDARGLGDVGPHDGRTVDLETVDGVPVFSESVDIDVGIILTARRPPSESGPLGEWVHTVAPNHPERFERDPHT